MSLHRKNKALAGGSPKSFGCETRLSHFKQGSFVEPAHSHCMKASESDTVDGTEHYNERNSGSQAVLPL